jgi:hypothetical protein
VSTEGINKKFQEIFKNAIFRIIRYGVEVQILIDLISLMKHTNGIHKVISC